MGTRADVCDVLIVHGYRESDCVRLWEQDADLLLKLVYFDVTVVLV